MRATIWNDAFQMVIVLVSFLLLTIFGAIATDGLGNAMEIASEGGRTNFNV